MTKKNDVSDDGKLDSNAAETLQRLASLGELTAGIVHQARNRMTGALAFAQVGKRGADAKNHSLFANIETELLSCMRLFESVLRASRTPEKTTDVSPPEVGRRSVRDIISATTGLTQSHLRMRSVELEVKLPHDMSTELRVRDAAGSAVPPTTAPDGDWSMFRAYTSLLGAEAGAENTGILLALRNFDTFSQGKDIVTSDEVWNIACYADAIETTPANIKGWVTGANNLIRIFAPIGPSQVGESQRHDGTFNTSAFLMDIALGGSVKRGMEINEHFVRIQGLQIRANGGEERDSVLGIGHSAGTVGPTNDIRISHSVIRGNFTGAEAEKYGIDATDGINWKLWNTVIFDIAATGNSSCVYQDGGSTLVAYNNTGFNCSSGMSEVGATTTAKNNIFPSYAGTFETGSDNNISGDLTTTGGAADQTSAAMDFVDVANGDFHLAPSFSAALGQGLDLGADTSLSFQDDLDSETRSSSWSIGADQ